MKKFGTPIGAGPGVASEKPGLVGAGEPSGLLSCGAGTTWAGDGLWDRLPRPEVEVESLVRLVEPAPLVRLPAFPVEWRACPCACVGVGVGVWPGVALGVELEPGVAVPVASGVSVFWTGDAYGVAPDGGAVAVWVGEEVGAWVGAEVAVCVGADVAVWVGADVGAWVGAEVAVCVGADVAVSAGVDVAV